MLVTRCEHCRARIQVPSSGRYRCHVCHEIIEIPEALFIKQTSHEHEQTIKLDSKDEKVSGEPEKSYYDQEIGARCRHHPMKKALYICRSCGDMLCMDCAIKVENHHYCNECIRRYSIEPGKPLPGDKTRAAEDESSIPFENYKKTGLLKAFGLTIKEIYAKFGNIFNYTGEKSNLVTAFFFGFVINIIHQVATVVYNNYILFQSVELPEEIPPFFKEALEEYFSRSPKTLLYAPLAIPASMFLLAFVYHIGVLIMGGQGKFSATFKISCYSSAALLIEIVIYPIPILPALLTFIMTIMIVIHGCMRLHKLSEGKAVFVALFPVMLLAALIVIFFATAFRAVVTQ